MPLSIGRRCSRMTIAIQAQEHHLFLQKFIAVTEGYIWSLFSTSKCPKTLSEWQVWFHIWNYGYGGKYVLISSRPKYLWQIFMFLWFLVINHIALLIVKFYEVIHIDFVCDLYKIFLNLHTFQKKIMQWFSLIWNRLYTNIKYV